MNSSLQVSTVFRARVAPKFNHQEKADSNNTVDGTK
jgi:hypothetical protein